MNSLHLLLAILDEKADHFLTLKSYQSQSEFLRSILVDYEAQFVFTIKLEIRWREKILLGKCFEYKKIMMYCDSLQTQNEKLRYLLLVAKNIKQQIFAMRQDNIFEYENSSLLISTPNDDLEDYLSFQHELWLGIGAKVKTESINNWLHTRSVHLNFLLDEINYEIEYIEKCPLIDERGKLKNRVEELAEDFGLIKHETPPLEIVKKIFEIVKNEKLTTAKNYKTVTRTLSRLDYSDPYKSIHNS